MRRLLVAAAAALGVVNVASAADMPVKAPVYKAPPTVAVYNWTGFYIGGSAGYSWGHASADSTLGATGLGFATGPCTAGCSFSQSVSPNSFAGGVQAGYNYQTGAWVLGIETDFQWRSRSADNTVVFNAFPDNQVISDKQTWFGTVRGRIGTTALSPAWLLYITGGFAYGHFEHTVTQNFAPGGGAPFIPRVYSDSDTRIGWVVGGGTEYKLAPHWSVGAEYLYTEFASDTLNAPAAITGPASFPASTTTFKDRAQVARIKLNYSF